MSHQAMFPCLKCEAPSDGDPETPLCWAHGGLDAPDLPDDLFLDDFLTEQQSDEVDSYLTTDGERLPDDGPEDGEA